MAEKWEIAIFYGAIVLFLCGVASAILSSQIVEIFQYEIITGTVEFLLVFAISLLISYVFKKVVFDDCWGVVNGDMITFTIALVSYGVLFFICHEGFAQLTYITFFGGLFGMIVDYLFGSIFGLIRAIIVAIEKVIEVFKNIFGIG